MTAFHPAPSFSASASGQTAPNWRIVMSSIMRRRSGLMGSVVMVSLLSEAGLEPHDLQSGRAEPDSLGVITDSAAPAITASAV
jgi:hypothetical protein